MRIRRKFLQLTRKTYPYGLEHLLESYLPKGYKKDQFDNYYLQIGEDPTTMFTCHLDNATSKHRNVTHIFDGKYVRTNGKTILGADDKAGMVVLLYMIEKRVPGLYYFFIGEEVGCIGSGALSSKISPDLLTITKCVSFDRRDTCSVITHQMMGRCCSNDFASELATRLNSTSHGIELYPDDTGVLTDSAQFMEIIPECTNISVGYYDEHTTRECQDLDYLSKLCKAVCDIDWETLPVKRNPAEYDEDDIFTSRYSDVWRRYTEPEMKTPDPTDYKEYDPKFYTYILQQNSASKKMYVSQTWINYEKLVILNWLKSTGFSTNNLEWDGNDCWVEDAGVMDHIGSRSHLIPYIDKLSQIPFEHLKETI